MYGEIIHSNNIHAEKSYANERDIKKFADGNIVMARTKPTKSSTHLVLSVQFWSNISTENSFTSEIAPL